jgi:uncharacterized protein (TIGR02284 family)
MTVETKTNLTDESLTMLQDLISVNLDSEKGFTEVGEHCGGNTIVIGLCEELARQRAANARELQALVGINGEQPEETGTVAGTCHRFLLDLRGKLGGGVPVMMIEAARGEEFIKSKYEAALKEHAGSAVTDVLNRQYVGLQDAYTRICNLKEVTNA